MIENVTGPEFPPMNGKFPFFTTPEWTKPATEGPLKFYASAWKEALEFAAACLESQAEYSKNLARCAGPAEVLKCHAEFTQKSWARSCDESAKLLDNMRTNFTAPSNR